MVVTEVSIMHRAREGDHTAFEAIFDQYQRPIYNYVLRMIGDPEEASDLTQEAFIKAYVALAKTPSDLNLSAWLYRIATNTCIDALRRKKILTWQPWETFTKVFHPKQVAPDNPEQELLRKEDAQFVQEVLCKLPPRYRQCLILREYQDLPCSQIAEIMEISPSALKSLMFRAREAFKARYLAATRVGGGIP